MSTDVIGMLTVNPNIAFIVHSTKMEKYFIHMSTGQSVSVPDYIMKILHIDTGQFCLIGMGTIIFISKVSLSKENSFSV